MSGASGDSGQACRPSRDFLRHIVNPLVSKYSTRMPLTLIDDLKRRLGRAEDRYRFSVYNGDPARLLDYLASEDFTDLVKYVKALNQDWIVEEILKALSEEYANDCPSVAGKAREILERIKSGGVDAARETITVDGIARMLKLAGYRVERTEDGKAVIEEPNLVVTIWQSGEGLEYQICRKGKVTTFEALTAKISKIREV